MTENSNPFWAFSLDRYRRDGVPEQCLIIQDRGGADVNFALFLLWLGSAVRSVNPETGLDTIRAHVADWTQDVVVPLRTVRRTLKGREDPTKGSFELLRSQIKKVELDSERIEQDLLYRLWQTDGPCFAEPCGDPADKVMLANLSLYIASLSVGDPELDCAAETLARLCV